MARPDDFHKRLQQAIADNPLIPETAKNQIYADSFAVPVYRVGRKWVVDRATLEAYFEAKRALSLAALRQKINR